jgi:hypothetical protein
MAHRSPEDLQDRRDIHRAQILLGLARGLTDGESAEALRRRAAAESVSIHAAALAVLSDSPMDDELAFSRPVRTGRHLSAVASLPPRHDP